VFPVANAALLPDGGGLFGTGWGRPCSVEGKR